MKAYGSIIIGKVIVDQGKVVRPSQLIASVRRTITGGAMRRAVHVVVSLQMVSCASTTWYARRPEAERSSHVAASRLRPGMTLSEVVSVMIESRLTDQYAALSSGSGCPEKSVDLVLHAGEPIARVGHTRVFAAGYASIQVYTRADAKWSSHGFERQGPFLEAVRASEVDLVGCPTMVLAFDAKVEGGCGESKADLTFDAAGRLATIGPVEEGECSK